MKLPFEKQMTIYLILLYFISLSIFAHLHFSFKISWFWSLVLGLLPVSLGSYFIFKNFTYHIQRIIEVIRGFDADYRTKEVYLPKKLSVLPMIIDEMAGKLRKKILEISEEKEYLQTILKGMVEGVLVVNEKKRIKMMNEALRSFLGFSFDWADKTPLEVIRNVELEAAIGRVLNSGNKEAFEMELPAASKKTFEVNVVPIFDPNKGSNEKILGAIVIFHDITRLKSLERIRQDFVANVSHELRSPLTLIKGYAETLLNGALKEEVAQQFIQIINKHTDRLTKLVEDLLTLSKIESKEFQLNLEVLSVRDLIDEVIGFIKEPAAKKKITIFKNEISSSLNLMGDRNYLDQVLINLLDNAIKYTSEGGKITISALQNYSGEIQISIEDNGIGIPREDLSRIFERFYRVDKGRSRELGGTGLGLAIVKHLVHAHGGKVWAESLLGVGSTFYLTLPSAP